MEKKAYLVTNNFTDKETGENILAGSIFEADDERAVALKAADVIGKEVSESKSGDWKEDEGKDASKVKTDAAKKEEDDAKKVKDDGKGE